MTPTADAARGQACLTRPETTRMSTLPFWWARPPWAHRFIPVANDLGRRESDQREDGVRRAAFDPDPSDRLKYICWRPGGRMGGQRLDVAWHA
ncbi:MAG: hypothetical protein ACQESR_14935 [Planctomycetota bacterium]